MGLHSSLDGGGDDDDDVQSDNDEGADDGMLLAALSVLDHGVHDDEMHTVSSDPYMQELESHLELHTTCIVPDPQSRTIAHTHTPAAYCDRPVQLRCVFQVMRMESTSGSTLATRDEVM